MPQSEIADYPGFVQHLRAALPYLEDVQSNLFAIHLDARLLEDPGSRLLEDLVLLRQVGIRMLLILDISKLVEGDFQQQGVPVEWRGSTLIVPETQIEAFRNTCATTLWKWTSRLKSYGERLQPLSGMWVRAEPSLLDTSIEPHRCGHVQELDQAGLRAALEHSGLLLIPPLALGSKGREWALDSLGLAVELAAGTRCQKLLILESSAIPEIDFQMTTEEMELWVQNQEAAGALHEPLRSRFRALIQACRRGVPRSYLLDGNIDGGVLAELLTPTGIGLMVTDRTYRKIRAAHISDVQAIHEILQRPVQQAALVLRTPEEIARHIERFLLFCLDEGIVGCCEVVHYEEEQAVELASLAVDSSFRNRGVGRELVQAAMDRARQQKARLLFALTTGNAHLFVQSGMRPLQPSQLPQLKQQAYDFQDSRIYGKELRVSEQ